MTSHDPDLRARFLAGMSHLAATVNVVTTDGAAGRGGITVSAMSSVSADTPRPTLLVCVHRDGSAAPMILENGVFCVNVLRDDQAYISDAFAGRFRDQLADKFECAEWRGMTTGAPRVVDPLVAFDCRVVSSELVGTHHVFFGEVHEIYMASHGSPLIYARRAYVHITYGGGMSPDFMNDPEAEGLFKQAKSLLDDVQVEDKRCTERVYRGLCSNAARPGHLSHLERPIYDFATYLADRVG